MTSSLSEQIGILLLGALITLIFTYLANAPSLILPAISVLAAIIAIIFRKQIKEQIFCNYCLGNGSFRCLNNFCQSGLIRAVPRVASWSNAQVKKEANSYTYEVSNVGIDNPNNFPGAFEIIGIVRKIGLNNIVGSYKSNVLKINSKNMVIPRIAIELDNAEMLNLEYGFKRPIETGDLYASFDVNLVGPGYLCTACGGTGKSICTNCKGKRLNTY